jgi:pimeloyl-ACP methyl ester carboxylesterase
MTHLGYDIESPVWKHWVRDLSLKNRFIRYDERGCGLSDWDAPDFTFDDWVADLESVVEALGLERFPLLGVSQGGAVAVAYAARHPERVSHLVLCSAYTRGRAVRAIGDEEKRAAALDLELARVGWGA